MRCEASKIAFLVLSPLVRMGAASGCGVGAAPHPGMLSRLGVAECPCQAVTRQPGRWLVVGVMVRSSFFVRHRAV